MKTPSASGTVFFAEPNAGVDVAQEINQRLSWFLHLAFRGPVDSATVQRYTAYVQAKRKQGMAFSDAMRKVSAAALSSPLFLFRVPARNEDDRQYALASKLSYFLWGSCPDEELLQLAEQNRLRDPEVLDAIISRMIADPKIERFLDGFPVQWLQLENVIAATPDPKQHPYFYLEREMPASAQMVVEPLLLFDSVFVEDRPLVELLEPQVSYRSDFLAEWYQGSLRPPPIESRRDRRNESGT